MSKTIIVTGGCGYIGSHTVVELLQNTDWDIISIDDFRNSNESVISRIIQAGGRGFRNIAIDLADQAAVQAIADEIGQVDGIIHFAAFKSVPDSVANPMAYYRNNLDGLLNILDLHQQTNSQAFVFSSSCTVYGNPEKLPVTEETPLQPAESPYGYTKVAGERIVRDVTKASGTGSALLLRYFNPAGAHPSGLIGEDPRNMAANLVPIIAEAANGERDQVTIFGNDYDTTDGTCVRDYIHVSDVASAHVAALKTTFSKPTPGDTDIINLGSGTGTTVQQVVDVFQEQNNVEVPHTIGPRRPGDCIKVYADITKAKRVLEWEPQYTLQDIVTSAWQWKTKEKADR